MFAKLRSFTVDKLDLDEGVALLAFGKSVIAEYSAIGVPAPEWLVENVSSLQKNVKERHRDMLEAKLKEVQSRRAALKTAEEKRADLAAEERALREKLGLPAS